MEKGLILVGAGPGDPELLTIKGLKVIQKAEVLLYDALVSEELVQYAPKFCKKIYVGKRAGMHSMAQSAINSLILKYAERNLVVRLKGGDPFVFGRGFEEMNIAIENDISVQVIPGVTSAISGPASVGIPVTTRGVSRSFWAVTATTAEGLLTEDLKLASQSSATIVIMMGLKKIDSIVKLIKKYRGCLEPMAVIQNATCANQQLTIGNAENVVHLFQSNKVDGPGIIVVGKVIEESKTAQLLVQNLKENVLVA